MGNRERPMRFDGVAAGHGAASVGLMAIFASGGVLVLTRWDEPQGIGCALLVVSMTYLVSMGAFGRLTRHGGALAGRFSFRAASQGAAGFSIVAIFGCAGVILLSRDWMEQSAAYGVALLLVAALTLFGFLWFGWMSNACNMDTTEESQE